MIGCVAGGLVLAPWALFNLLRFDEPTVTTTGFGSALSAASCDAVYYGSNIGYYDNCFQGPFGGPGLDESERDVAPREAAVEYMKDNVTRLPLVALARVGRIWGLFKPGQTTAFDWSIEGRGRVPSWIGLFSFYALMAFAIYGLVVLVRQRVTILPLLAPPVIITVAAALTFGVTRYRAPAEVSIVVAAAVGVTALAGRGRGPDRARRTADDAARAGGTLASR